MANNIVKHSYIKGRDLTSRALAHIDYIQYRPGEDKKEPERSEKDSKVEREADQEISEKRGKAREFHTPAGDGKGAFEFRKAFQEENKRGFVVHKFVLSPVSNEVDVNKYTQEVMDSISRAKGQDLRYGWVVHDNTDHKHAHVIVLGSDTEGHQVRFNKLDHMRMRAFGDRYLEREHGLERHFDADMERYARVHGVNVMFEQEGKERFIELLEQPDDKKARDAERDTQDWRWVDDDWKKLLAEPDYEPGMRLGSSQMHQVGRLSEIHSLYQNTQQIDTWENILENVPELKDVAEKKLAELQAERDSHVKDLQERSGITDPDKFLEKLNNELASRSASEARQLDMAFNPEKYEPRDWDRSDIDLSKVPAEDKIRLSNGDVITKYDSSDYLKEIDQDLRDGALARIDREQYGKMWSWLGHKEAAGEMYYGEPPLKEIDREHDTDREQEKEKNRLDLDRVAPEDKIELHTGRIITKYDSLWNLERLHDRDYDPHYSIERLPQEDRERFFTWLIDKREHGEEVYGRGPRLGDERADADKEPTSRTDMDSRDKPFDPLEEASQREPIQPTTDLDTVSRDISYEMKELNELLSMPRTDLEDLDRAHVSDNKDLRETIEKELGDPGSINDHDRDDYHHELTDAAHDNIDLEESRDIFESISGEEGDREPSEREPDAGGGRDRDEPDREEEGRRTREDHDF